MATSVLPAPTGPVPPNQLVQRAIAEMDKLRDATTASLAADTTKHCASLVESFRKLRS
jgi:hypothetical protein